jgi:cell division protein FtsA
MYATAVGLVMKAALDSKATPPESNESIEEETQEEEPHPAPNSSASRKSIFDRFTEKLKEFLDNAE